MSANEIVLRDHQCKEKKYIRKTKNIYAYICEDEEEEREFKKLTLHKWNADAAEGDELKVRTRNVLNQVVFNVLKNPNPLKDVEASALLCVVGLV